MSNIMGKSVAEKTLQNGTTASTSLYAPDGARKYLNREERCRVLQVAEALAPSHRLFILMLAWTGARVSEVLALIPASFQIADGIVAFHTLKRRRHSVREVPLPCQLVGELDACFGIGAAQRDPAMAWRRLWTWRRETVWRLVKCVMYEANLIGVAASPRGLRHSFGIGAVQAGVPLNIVQRWLGHARISTTAIYTDAVGPEEQALAERFWRYGAVRLRDARIRMAQLPHMA